MPVRVQDMRVMAWLAWPLALCVWASALWAAPPARRVQLPGPSDAPPVTRSLKALTHQPADYKSAHFLIHTDLSSKEAHALLGRLETMLTLISKYWNHPPVGVIECYVVDDLRHWPQGAIPGEGRAKIEQRAGITLVDTITLGNKPVSAKAVVYAVAERGTTQHEAVHAYCGQAFGRVGPLWYSEGMAEVGQYWRPGDTAVHCPDYVIEFIHSRPPKPLVDILSEDGVQRPGRSNAVTGDSWQNYAWRWALCHLLVNNSNYSARFRPLGLGYLSGARASFAETYESMLGELAFEYRFFLKHLDEGYRVDLCSWDWKHKFRELTSEVPATARVSAMRGWQGSGAIVEAGEHYEYSASGVWHTVKDGADVTADGSADGSGRLEGIILHDFELSEPFSLGAYGTFKAPASGKLYLRCHDAWNRLADNRGAMSVKIKPAAGGSHLPRPTRKIEDEEEEPSQTTAKVDKAR
jgi:hypothetical protein